jgi:SET domain-containing protein
MTTQTINQTSLVIKEGIHGRGVFAARKIPKGSVIFKMQGQYVNQPTRTSVQVSDKLHIEDALAGLINHSCQPTARIDRASESLVSLRDINVNEEVTFDYTTNEEKLAAPFECECCGREICGKTT